MSLKPAVAHDLHALRAAGASYAEIAQVTGLSKSAIANRLTGKIAAPRRNAGQQQRTCMCCGKPFLSDGAHNRLCPPCGRHGASPFDTPATVHYR